MKKFLLSIVLSVLMSLIVVSVALAMPMLQDEEPATISGALMLLEIALLGFLTFWLVEGAKKIYPPLQGFAVHLAAIATSFVMSLLMGLLLPLEGQTLTPLLIDLLLVAAGWLVANGFKRGEQRVLAALSGTAG